VPAIFDGLQLGVALLDLHCNPVDFNYTFAGMLGFDDRLEILSKSLWELVHPSDKGNVDVAADALLLMENQRDCTQLVPSRMRLKDGAYQAMVLRLSLIVGPAPSSDGPVPSTIPLAFTCTLQMPS
jgi:hypothetical protein